MLKYDKEKNSKLKVKKGVKVFIMHKTKRDTMFGYVCVRRGHKLGVCGYICMSTSISQKMS